MTWLAVVVGGALGSVARHGVNIATARVMGEPGPWSTASCERREPHRPGGGGRARHLCPLSPRAESL